MPPSSGDPPSPQPTASRASGSGITEAMANRLMMAGKERAARDHLEAPQVLQDALDSMGLPPLTGTMEWGNIRSQLMENVPSKIESDGYDQLYDLIVDAPRPQDPDPAKDDDIPF